MHYDAVVIGSGFGGTLAAHALVRAGLRVVMLERGDWVTRGPHNHDVSGQWKHREGYSLETPYALAGSGRRVGAFHCVGGPSVFYGGVALRLREEDFAADPDVSDGVGWPVGYRELEPWYDLAEGLLGVRGDVDDDPTAPPRRRPLPPPSLELSATSRQLRDAALRLGLRPFRLPLALNGDGAGGRAPCTACGICDGFPCATGSKNDLATAVLPDLIARGLVLRTNVVATRLAVRGERVVAVEGLDMRSGLPVRFVADRFVLAAGALATPHLLLASGLERLSPAGDSVGRHLMRHCNGVVLGASVPPAGGTDEFRKQLGLHDYYHGDPAAGAAGASGNGAVRGKLGAIQQIQATQLALLMAPLPRGLKGMLYPALERLVGFIVIAEDQPRASNRVALHPRERDRYGRPHAVIHHRYTARDLAARRALARRAAEILREAGAAFTLRVPVGTFSHALGTVRMGEDPTRFPVTPEGRFRGTRNLWITDGSVFPTSAGVNPSLTIAANALRVGAGIARSPSRSRELLRLRRAPSRPAGARTGVR